MLFPSLPNLSSTTCNLVTPWHWQPETPIPDGVRGKENKAQRDKWINAGDTNHCVYSGWEALNPNLRISKGQSNDDSNPPYKLLALVGDYDAPVSESALKEGLARVAPHVPNYYERSLSGFARFVWLLETPILVPSRAFAVHLLKYIETQIRASGFCVNFDKGAWEDPARYYTSGCDWRVIDEKIRIPSALSTGWLIEAGNKFLWKEISGHGLEIPLPDVEIALAEKYPNFKNVWGESFELGAQGPTFWIPESTSPKSAIVRETGIQTFAAHATKAFYRWEDLLGSKFVENYRSIALGRATQDIFHDGKSYFRKIGDGSWSAFSKEDIRDHLAVSRGVKSARNKSGPSDADRAIQHIQDHNKIEGAAPFVFKKSGLIRVSNTGRRFLNTHTARAMSPAEGKAVWGPTGQFPWVSQYLGNFFAPREATAEFPCQQLDYFLAWLQRFYRSAHSLDLESGQNVFIAGKQSKGKTFLNVALLGRLLGGHADARDYLMGEDAFGSELFESALWSIDDATMTANYGTHKKFSEMVKKMAANKTFRFHAKFRIPLIVEWQGRVVVTCNVDAESLRILPDMELSILDKLMLFRANDDAPNIFKSQAENHATLDKELPWFARWLLDWQAPLDTQSADPRYGVVSYHDESLVQSAKFSSRSAGFREMLEDFRQSWFSSNSSANEWSGSAVQLYKAIGNIGSESILRAYSLEDFTRRLGQLQNTGYDITTVDEDNMRLWKLARPGGAKPSLSNSLPPQSANSTFSTK